MTLRASFRSFLGVTSVILLSLSVASFRLDAQVLYGSIVGSVSDPTDSAVSRAAVEVTEVGTGRKWETATSSAGIYSFTTLPAGTYKVGISAPGFRSYLQQGVTLTGNTVVRVNAHLDLGTVAESVSTTICRSNGNSGCA